MRHSQQRQQQQIPRQEKTDRSRQQQQQQHQVRLPSASSEPGYCVPTVVGMVWQACAGSAAFCSAPLNSSSSVMACMLSTTSLRVSLLSSPAASVRSRATSAELNSNWNTCAASAGQRTLPAACYSCFTPTSEREMVTPVHSSTITFTAAVHAAR
jgi:hypothetical protein